MLVGASVSEFNARWLRFDGCHRATIAGAGFGVVPGKKTGDLTGVTRSYGFKGSTLRVNNSTNALAIGDF